MYCIVEYTNDDDCINKIHIHGFTSYLLKAENYIRNAFTKEYEKEGAYYLAESKEETCKRFPHYKDSYMRHVFNIPYTRQSLLQDVVSNELSSGSKVIKESCAYWMDDIEDEHIEDWLNNCYPNETVKEYIDGLCGMSKHDETFKSIENQKIKEQSYDKIREIMYHFRHNYYKGCCWGPDIINSSSEIFAIVLVNELI
jgi:hypothetical protein